MPNIDRTLLIASFLENHGWSNAVPQSFDGDFSPRRYARLASDKGTAILMDADADQKTAQFISVSNLLRSCGALSPEIYAADADQGLVLMQDFGTGNIGGLLDVGAKPAPYFKRAATALAQLHRVFDRGMAVGLELPLFNVDLFVKQAELFLDAWFPFKTGRDASKDERDDYQATWRAVLRPLEIMPKSLLLRDFMPDNLMDVPGTHQVGILDFQDSGIGPVAYDLASLCEEVRRDGGFAFLPEVISQYKKEAASPLSDAELLRGATILSAQRHMRILGLITAHRTRTGRDDKVLYVPRVQKHLRRVLNEPYLAPVKEWVERHDVS